LDFTGHFFKFGDPWNWVNSFGLHVGANAALTQWQDISAIPTSAGIGISFDIWDGDIFTDNNLLIAIDVGYALRTLLGDISLEHNDDIRELMLDPAPGIYFHGIEFGPKFQFNDLAASFRVPILSGGVLGLSGGQIIASLSFKGDFMRGAIE